MTMDQHVSAIPEAFRRIRDLAGSAEDGPVLMLNCNRYTEAAGFPDGEAYRTYMERLHHSVEAGGGRVLWRTSVTDTVIGCDHDRYDEILAVWYPDHAAFVALPKADGAAAMFESRQVCVANAAIHALPADQAPFRP